MESTREKLAALQHRIWTHWMLYLFSCCTMNEDGSATIPREKVECWQQQMRVPYHELSDAEKNSVRERADKVIKELRL